MKKIIIILISVLFSTSLFSQQIHMKIRKTDGSIYSLPISLIDSVYYQEDSTFVCGQTVTDYDGNVYNTVQIGNQCWMQQNMKATHYHDGTAISNITDNNEWGALGNNNIDDAYCAYNNDNNNIDIYGAIYTWAAAMGDNAVSSSSNPSNVQGVCPDGWHIPSDLEYTQLTDFLGGDTIAGSKMKDFDLWATTDSLNNSSGFSLLPSGYRNGEGTSLGVFYSLTYNAYLWSSTESNGSTAYVRKLHHNDSIVERLYLYKSHGFSVRCVKDE